MTESDKAGKSQVPKSMEKRDIPGVILSEKIFVRISKKMNSMATTLYKRIGKANPFVRYGLPMISLTILGSFALSQLQQGRKDVMKARDDEEWAIINASKALSREGPLPGYERKKKRDLEQDLKEYRQKVDIDSYEYKPVPKIREKE